MRSKSLGYSIAASGKSFDMDPQQNDLLFSKMCGTYSLCKRFRYNLTCYEEVRFKRQRSIWHRIYHNRISTSQCALHPSLSRQQTFPRCVGSTYLRRILSRKFRRDRNPTYRKSLFVENITISFTHSKNNVVCILLSHASPSKPGKQSHSPWCKILSIRKVRESKFSDPETYQGVVAQAFPGAFTQSVSFVQRIRFVGPCWTRRTISLQTE